MCGLFGVIYKKRQLLDKVPFISLGRDNVKRGKDSCGIVIDNQVEYGYGSNAIFETFYKGSKLLKETTECTIAIGHTRAGSPGFKTDLQQAQPICIYEGNKLQFVVTHNGTIEGKAKDLAQKYIPDLEIGDNTDSWILAQIMYRHGFDVLGEYKGYGAFIIVDYRPAEPQFYMFKGASKQYTNDKELTVERPLFMTIENNAIWWASEMGFLEAARYGNPVYCVKSNTLYHIENHTLKLEHVKEYDRSWFIQQPSRWYGGYNYQEYYSDYSSITSYKAPDYGKLAYPLLKSDYKVYYDVDGLYKLNNKPIDKKLMLDSCGYQVPTTSVLKNEYGFFQGYLLYCPQAYDLLDEVCTQLKLTHEDFLDNYPEVVQYLSYLPFVGQDKPIRFYKQLDLDTCIEYEDKLSPIFGGGVGYTIKEGYIIEKDNYAPGALTKYNTESATWVKYIEESKLHILTKIYNFIASSNA